MIGSGSCMCLKRMPLREEAIIMPADRKSLEVKDVCLCLCDNYFPLVPGYIEYKSGDVVVIILVFDEKHPEGPGIWAKHWESKSNGWLVEWDQP